MQTISWSCDICKTKTTQLAKIRIEPISEKQEEIGPSYECKPMSVHAIFKPYEVTTSYDICYKCLTSVREVLGVVPRV